MSLFFNRSAWPTPTQMVAERSRSRSSRVNVDRRQALTQSTVWACLRLRADIVSTLPVDIFRRVNGIQVEVPKPPIFITPGGSRVRWVEWAYSSQFDLDSYGNTFGIIRARDGLGMPAVIELVPAGSVGISSKNGIVTYRIDGKSYAEADVWHEKQFTIAGFPLGLSPIAHAAMAIYGYVSAQEFANDWFSNSAVPSGHLKNNARTLNRKQSLKAKASFKAAVSSGDVWVSGNDWEYNVFNAKASEAAFLDTMRVSDSAVCRYLGVPGDMVDVETATGKITYANVTQRNLQFLILNLGPTITRREDAFSANLLPTGRYAKINTNALLRMDLQGRYESYKIGIAARFITPNEARELEERGPLTPEQEDEFARLFPVRRQDGGMPALSGPSSSSDERSTGETHHHSHVTLSVPTTISPADVRVEIPPAETHIENRIEMPSVEAPAVHVENRVETPSVEVQAPAVDVHVTNQVETPSVEVHAPVDVTVQPADVNLPARERRILRDPKTNEITGIVEE